LTAGRSFLSSTVNEPAATPLPPPTTALAPLAQPVFRMLWSAWLMANVCLWMNEVAAAWLMTTLTTSPVMVALVQTASTLPMFVLGLPSGALADIIDRRRYLMFTQLWIASIALLLAAVVVGGGIAPTLLLALTFANGIGLAMRWPTFAAIIPEVVPRVQLPAALALNGVSMNASRIVGPVVAGALIAGAGAVWVFILNALLSLTSAFLVWRWRREFKPSALPGERFVGAMRVGVQYVRQSPRLRAVLVRIALFFLQSSALLALLPLVAKRLPHGDAGTYTLLLAAMGLGAVTAGVFLPRLRADFSRDALVQWGSVVQALAMVTVALANHLAVALPAMLVAGAAWIAVANSLTLSAQIALPDWVRARGMSIYQMSLMGGSAAGAALWGQVASWSTVSTALAAAATTGLVLLPLSARLKLEAGADEDVAPTRPFTPPTASALPRDAGPILVTIEYRIDPARAAEFRTVMEESRRARLRLGALSWELFHDVSDPARYIEYFIDESWVEHLRRFERFSAADVSLRERRLAFHIGDDPPRVSRFVADA
jgi:MFS family permease